MTKTTAFWSEVELKSEIGNNALSDKDAYLLNVDLILFDTRLRSESLESLFDMIGRLRASDSRQRDRLIRNVERILVDTRLHPQHSPMLIGLLRKLRQAEDVLPARATEPLGR